MRRSRKFCQRGDNYDIFFVVVSLFMRRKRIQYHYKRAHAKRHLNGVSLVCL